MRTIGIAGTIALVFTSAVARALPGHEKVGRVGAEAAFALTPSQDRNAPKRPPLIPPKRIVAVHFVDVKLTKASSPTGFSAGFGAGNTSGSGSQSTGSIEISSAADFAQGVADVMITSLTESKGFLVIELPPPPKAGDPPAVAGAQPELMLRAVVTDMTCRKMSGGLTFGALSGDQGQYENKVTMDVRLVDPVTNVVIDSVKATGKKTSKSSIFSVTKWTNGSYLNPATKVLDLTYADFEDTPLAEATRLATQDAIKKLIEKAQSRPWEASVIKVVQEGTGPEFYLNVGPECGLQVGDQLELLRLGEVLTDEKSGKVIGRARPKPVGLLTVSITSEEFVICRPSPALSIQDLDPGQSHIVRVASRPRNQFATPRVSRAVHVRVQRLFKEHPQ